MRNSEKFTGTGNLVYILTGQGLKSIWQLLNSKESQHRVVQYKANVSSWLLGACFHQYRTEFIEVWITFVVFENTFSLAPLDFLSRNFAYAMTVPSLSGQVKMIKGVRGNRYFAQRICFRTSYQFTAPTLGRRLRMFPQYACLRMFP